MNTDIEALAAQYEAEEDEVIDSLPQEEPNEEPEEPEEVAEDVGLQDDTEEADDSPPGYKTYDEWVAEGKDPEAYKGRKAYEAEYKRIQEVKGLKDEVKSMSGVLKSTIDAITERETKAEERHRKELEAALNNAKEIADVDTALALQQELNDIKPRAPGKQEHPVISRFVGSNQVLESPEVKSEFARIYNGKLRADGVSPQEELSEAAVNGYLRASLESIKTLYPDKFVSPRVSRQGPARQKAKAPKARVDVEKALREYKVDGVSSTNSDAAIGIYKSIKATQGEGAAKTYAERLLGVKL